MPVDAPKLKVLFTLLISRGAILNIKFMTSFAESNLSSCAYFITLIAGHRPKKTQDYKKMTERGYCWYYLDHCSKTNDIETKGVIKRANTKTFLLVVQIYLAGLAIANSFEKNCV